MKKSISFPKDVEDALANYRKLRKEETGKLPFRDTAITELLRKALSGQQPPTTIKDRVDDIERRLSLLESQDEQDGHVTVPADPRFDGTML